MAGHTLHTLGRLELVGPDGPCRVDDPIALPLLVLAALAPGGGVGEDAAMLRLTPDLTPAAGRTRLTAAVGALTAAAGVPVAQYAEGRLTLRRDLLSTDVETAAVAEANAVQAGFLAGLKPPSPEFADWVAEVRPRVRAARMASSGSRLGTPNDRSAALIALGGLVLLVSVWATRATPPPRFSPGDAIVLADLDNATGDTLFDRSLGVAAAVGLRQSARFSLLPRTRILAALRRSGLTGVDTVRLTLDLARDVAVRENSQYALGLRIERAGEGYRLTAVLTDAVSGETVRSAEANAETRAGTLNALDRLVEETRTGLGERRGEQRGRSRGIPEATTPSLEALRSFAQGSAAWGSGEYQIARELWERALDLDTGFAMAMGSLGGYFALHADRAQAQHYYAKALERKNRLTEWEQLHLEERFATLRGLTDSSFAIHQVIVARFPSAASWFDYGADLIRRGKPAEAVEALTRALEFDSSFANAHIDLALSLKALGRYDLALGHYQRAAGLDSTVLFRGFNIAEYGELLVRLGRFDEAERHFRRILNGPSIRDRPYALRSLGLLKIWRGRLDEGIGLLRQATSASIQLDAPTAIGALRGRSFEGLTLLMLGDRGQANRAFDSLMAHVGATIEPRALALFARGLIKANRIEDVRRLAALPRDTLGPDDRHALEFIAAAMAIAGGRPDSGMAYLAAGAASPQRQVTGWLRVEGLAGQRKTREALTLADSLLANPDFGNESELEWLSGVITAADLAAELGDRKAALAGYRRLIDLWSGGDRSSALLDHARAQVEALRIER